MPSLIRIKALKRRSTYFTAAYREKTVGASLGAGSMEVASELWTERVEVFRLSRFQRHFPVTKESVCRMILGISRRRQSARPSGAKTGGITDFTDGVRFALS